MPAKAGIPLSRSLTRFHHDRLVPGILFLATEKNRRDEPGDDELWGNKVKGLTPRLPSGTVPAAS
jgi:hypothetical protein